MTRDETKKILTMLSTAYQSRFMPNINEYVVNMWYSMLQDIDYKKAAIILQKWIMLEKFPPTIADIRKEVANQQLETKDAGDGWKEVMTAVRKYGAYREDEALDSMSEITREVVRRFGWETYCMMEESEKSIYFAQFRDVFNGYDNRQREHHQLSPALRDKLHLMSGELEDGNKALSDGVKDVISIESEVNTEKIK